ncbi:pyruvate kinase [Clostridium sardiniense]|uniref:pyruvate kinase n=1 Tax=Clostridium sardiniense TaxID=29369 RepID=UPI003D347C04
MQKTKMIVTLGSSINSKDTIGELIKNGMNVARINFFHSSYEEIKSLVKILNELDEELGTTTAILGDIRDSKIRTNKFLNKNAKLNTNDYFSFLCGSEILGDNTRCSISSSYLHENLNIGDKLYIDNGLISFEVVEILGREIKCLITDGGVISENKQINIPTLKNPSIITELMEKDIEFACNIGMNFISCSAVRTGADCLKYRDMVIEYGGPNIKLICEIENSDAVDNIDDILNSCYGIIISRGELGIDIPVEKIPFIQKDLIKRCNKLNKIVIVSTQVLSSMDTFPRPTRAESSDVFNAVLDGTTALMLTRTTAIGNYPLDTLKTLKRLLKDSEKHLDYKKYFKIFSNDIILDYDSLMASSVAEVSNKFPTKAIIVGTSNGVLPRSISKYRPDAPIIAITDNQDVAKSLSLNFGVTPFIYDKFDSPEEFMEEARNIALNNGLAKKYDTILVLTANKTFSWKNDNFKIVNL